MTNAQSTIRNQPRRTPSLREQLEEEVYNNYYNTGDANFIKDTIAFNCQMLARLDCQMCIRGEQPKYTVPSDIPLDELAQSVYN
jgi:hypothetical protein